MMMRVDIFRADGQTGDKANLFELRRARTGIEDLNDWVDG